MGSPTGPSYPHLLKFGANLGLMALALWAAAVITNPAVRSSRRARLFAGAALAFTALQIETVSLLAWCLYWVALLLAVLTPRAASQEDALRWLQRLAVAAFASLPRTLRDLQRIYAKAVKTRRFKLGPTLSALVTPLLGAAVFIGLFSTANPVISKFWEQLKAPDLDMWRVCFWLFALVGTTNVLRPASLRPSRLTSKAPPATTPPLTSDASVKLSLVVFNALFALENTLDAIFLWSGAKLPTGVTLADYAHKGAFSLIASSLFAGVFVLVALRPGTKLATDKTARTLVILWIAQNVFLVASCILRTWDYVEAYNLTALRIAALVWMALVATGLMLICWRMLAAKSAGWLINGNVAAAALVLTICSVVDLDAVAASWNVTHADDVGGTGAKLDVCYLEQTGSSALVSLAELSNRPLPASLKDRVLTALRTGEEQVAKAQGDWRTWTYRDMRRLKRVQDLTSGKSWLSRPNAEC